MLKIFMNRLWLIIILSLSPLLVSAQSEIRIILDKEYDSIFYLMGYKGKKITVADTGFCHKNKVVFRNKDINPGIYVLTDSKKQYLLEFLIGNDKKFTIDIKDIESYNSITVKGSEETSSYFDLMKETQHVNLYLKALESEVQYNPGNVLRMDSLRKTLNMYQKSLLRKNEDSFLNTFILSIMQPELPDSLRSAEDSLLYLRLHYWDFFPFYDENVLNYPLIENKLDYFFDVMLPVNPDIIIIETDKLIKRAENNTKVRDFILWYLYSKYQTTKYMNLDAVYVHLVENYFAVSDIENVTENIKKMMIDRAEVLKGLLLGVKAPQMSCTGIDGETHELYDIKSPYTIVYFYNPDCPLCKKEKRILNETVTRRNDIIIYAVNLSQDDAGNEYCFDNVSWICVDGCLSQEKDLISLYDIKTTPLIYVLDSEKRIIAKKIKAEQIELFIK